MAKSKQPSHIIDYRHPSPRRSVERDVQSKVPVSGTDEAACRCLHHPSEHNGNNAITSPSASVSRPAFAPGCQNFARLCRRHSRYVVVLGRTFGLISNLHRSNLTFNQDTRTWYLIDLEHCEDVTTERFPRMWTNVCNRMRPAGNGWHGGAELSAAEKGIIL